MLRKMPKTAPPRIDQVLGMNLERIRKEKGWSQDTWFHGAGGWACLGHARRLRPLRLGSGQLNLVRWYSSP